MLASGNSLIVTTLALDRWSSPVLIIVSASLGPRPLGGLADANPLLSLQSSSGRDLTTQGGWHSRIQRSSKVSVVVEHSLGKEVVDAAADT